MAKAENRSSVLETNGERTEKNSTESSQIYFQCCSKFTTSNNFHFLEVIGSCWEVVEFRKHCSQLRQVWLALMK